MALLSTRARSVLHAVVTEFIATGEPVGSRTLQRKYRFDLSPATIRNVLSDLEDDGFLAQPHTSAGRVPTAQAFRDFIDGLLWLQKLDGTQTARIDGWLARLPPGSDIVRESGRLLSDLTGSPAVAARPRSATRALRKLRFIITRPGEALAVVVFADGAVENRYLRIERSLDENELERIHRILEEVVEGRTLRALRDHFAARLAGSQDELAISNRLGLRLVEGALRDADRRPELVVEGVSRLLERSDTPGSDELRELYRVLEDKARLVALLDETLASTRVQVFFDEEVTGSPSTLSIVAAPYSEDAGPPAGVVGIIGPSRMDYATVVPLVGAAADAVSTAFARSRDDSE
ncbi:MAG: heat-inducible transcription repressor HrcA [Polyangiaceae bacterium]|nr:heat-inducible transcription repressor HrcA [Polyangiaceae bacterium]